MPAASANDSKNAKKYHPHCNKCGGIFEKRIPRDFKVKFFLWWVPLRRYYCSNCGSDYYIICKKRKI